MLEKEEFMQNTKDITINREVSSPLPVFSLKKSCETSNFLENLQDVISTHPDENAQRLGLSIIHLIEGKDDKVLNILTTLAESNAEIPLLWRRIAEIHLSQNNYKQAITHLEKTLKLDNEDLTAMIWLGFCYFQTGDRKKGTIIFEMLKESVYCLHAVNSNWAS